MDMDGRARGFYQPGGIMSRAGNYGGRCRVSLGSPGPYLVLDGTAIRGDPRDGDSSLGQSR